MATTPPPTTLGPTTLGPTTLATTPAPTTLAPTTLATTVAPTTTLTTLAPTTAVPDIDIDDSTLEIVLSQKSLLTLFPGPDRDATLDFTMNAGALEIVLSQEGANLNTGLAVDPLEITFSAEGTPVIGIVVASGLLEITFSQQGDQYLENRKCNWVAWSKIGSLDFDIDIENEAGERPMDWKGCVWKILKLDKSVVVYGENGVTVLKPSELVWAMQTVHRIGLLSRNAVAGSEWEHYFIDNTYKMYKVAPEGLPELLDYSEYFENLSSPIMVRDPETELIYICDGTTGYVFNPKYKALGTGPKNVTGFGTQGGTRYITGVGEIVNIPFYIITDKFDFGTRKAKTIHWVEISTDLENKVFVRLESKNATSDEWRTSRWVRMNPDGRAYCPAYGVDFKLHVKTDRYEYLEIDDIKFHGDIHGYSYLDTVGE